jgi:hypothetical protein|tara:strand:- start:1292 stop:1921 length:630 start_codon:yes stop_codon:yes gene_type:complete
MSTKKMHYFTPIGTFNYPWLDKPSKWDASARDGKGGSKPADPTDLNGSYSVKLTVDPAVFKTSDFKKQIDELWDLAQKTNKGKYDETKDPYWADDEGNVCLTARRQAAFQKDGKIQTMRPKLEDCTGRDITKYVEEEGIQVASESTGRLDVTTYVPVPKKKDGVATLRMNFDLVKAQFKVLKRYEADKSMAPIDGGSPVGEELGEAIPY